MSQTENHDSFHDPLEALEKLHLDQERIQDWVTQFADLLETPELWDDIADWF